MDDQDDSMRGLKVLVTGGARSGKSAWAERQLADFAAVTYIATSQNRDDDPEWQQRVRIHQQRRPSHWQTIETIELVDVLLAADDAPILIDCMSVWLTRVLDEVGAWPGEPGWQQRLNERKQPLFAALQRSRRTVILVTNEVGLGVVPATPAGRLFRDELGRLNAELAQLVDQVWLSVSGITRRWDGPAERLDWTSRGECRWAR